MSFDVKPEIMKAINGTNDQAMRTVLTLILGVFESISEKLDKVLGDEKEMRKTVLNGHADSHDGHHEWVEKRIKRDHEIEALVAWARKRKKQEEDDEQSGRKIRDGLLEKIIFAAILSVVSFVAGRGSF